jgi:hypothetical protein
MGATPVFELTADDAARAWLDAHPSTRGWVIAYDVHRCCGGGKICQVDVRPMKAKDVAETYVPGTTGDGATFLVDRRAAARLPRRFGLTVRGLGRWKHLDLKLEPDQWGDLLYHQPIGVR